jgi:hypothetical protein
VCFTEMRSFAGTVTGEQLKTDSEILYGHIATDVLQDGKECRGYASFLDQV